MAQQSRLERAIAMLNQEEKETLQNARDHIDNASYLSVNEKYLLHMSKVLTGKDTCVAIYPNSEEGFLVANNTNDNRHFESVMAIMRRFSHDGNRQAAEAELVRLLHRSPAYISGEDRSGKSSAESLLSGAKQQMPNEANIMQDVGIILDGFDVCGGREFVERARFIGDPAGEMHAEMRLLPTVVRDAKGKEGFDPVIITSKLMCNPCDIAIGVVNTDPRLGVKIRTTGTHGKSYPKWVAPEIPDFSLEQEVTLELENQCRALQQVKQQAKLGKVLVESPRDQGEEAEAELPWQRKTTAAERKRHEKTIYASAGFTHLASDEPALLKDSRELVEYIQSVREEKEIAANIEALVERERRIKDQLAQCEGVMRELDSILACQHTVDMDIQRNTKTIEEASRRKAELESERARREAELGDKKHGRKFEEFKKYDVQHKEWYAEATKELTQAQELAEKLQQQNAAAIREVDASQDARAHREGKMLELKLEQKRVKSEKRDAQVASKALREKVVAIRAKLEKEARTSRPKNMVPQRGQGQERFV